MKDNIDRMPRNYTLLTDEYEFTMSASYLKNNKTGYALADVMVRHGKSINGDKLIIVDPVNVLKQTEIENYTLVPLQKQIFDKGTLVYNDPTILEKRDYCETQMATIYPEIKREMNPHTYYVDGTLEYVEFKNDMIKSLKNKVSNGGR